GLDTGSRAIGHEKKGGMVFHDCLPLCIISPSSVLIKKQLWEEVGYFDEALPACEDYDLWLRVCAIYPVLFIDEPLTIKYGGHEDQLSKKYWGMDRFRIQALAKVLTSGVAIGADKRAACTMLHKKCKILIKGAVKHKNQAVQDYCMALMKRHPLDFDADLRSAVPVSELTTKNLQPMIHEY
ncbi:MAG: glycosyltransferase family 2 protein, partial [bacterium]